MEETTSKVSDKIEKLVSIKKPDNLVSFLKKEVESGEVTLAEIVNYARNKIEDKKTKVRLYKMTADKESGAACINYARHIKDEDIDEAILYTQKSIALAKKSEDKKKREKFLEELLELQKKSAKDDGTTDELVVGIATPDNVRKQEVEVQKYVHDRFFRFKKPFKTNSKSKEIYDRLVGVDGRSEQEVKGSSKAALLENISKFKPIGSDAKLAAIFYLKERIVLDGYSSRSVVIALSKFLNEKGYIPTAVYQIGNTHILCLSVNNFGKVLLQTITEQATVSRNPTVYGDGEADKSMFQQLEVVAKNAEGINIHGLLRPTSVSIGSLGNLDVAPYLGFLDKLNFLRTVMEVARYSFRPQQGSGDLDELPIGVSQQRTSQLLIEGEIKVHKAYGLDKEIYSGSSMRYDFKVRRDMSSPDCTVHKSPFGVVTGTSLKDNIDEVENKTHRINGKYNQRYSIFAAEVTDDVSVDDAKDNGLPKPLLKKDHHSVIEGPTLLRSKLAEEYGSGGESDHSNYSDQEAEAFIKDFEKMGPRRK
jgi:hypothetical protein